ncbi:MAG: hypothetical protein WD824_15950 [Cyclobacteriaceae bacterium]
MIAYLHLVLVGVITLFLWAWYLEMKYVDESFAKIAMIVLFTGFTGSELCLVMAPWWHQLVGGTISASIAIFVFSVFMFASSLLFYGAYWAKAK